MIIIDLVVTIHCSTEEEKVFAKQKLIDGGYTILTEDALAFTAEQHQEHEMN